MKITITALPAEQEEAGAVLALLRRLYPKAKVRRDKCHPPHSLLYLRTVPGGPQRLTPCDLCRHDPPSSCDGKSCSVCPASPKPWFSIPAF